MNLEEARKFSQQLELPGLKGSWEQIQQAEQIRAEKLKDIPSFEQNWDNFLDQLAARLLSDYSVVYLKQADDASFWIENEHLHFWELLELFE
jgi:hypothetical protein